MKKPTKQQELERWQEIANAFFRFVQRHPPEGFNKISMLILAETGRYDELVKMLDDFGEKSGCACAKAGKKSCGNKDGCGCGGH